MADKHPGKLLRNVEGGAYWTIIAPVLARLPATLGYRLACWRGDCLSWCQRGKQAKLARNLLLVLGQEVDAAAAQGLTRDWFRFAACEAVDIKRLRRAARPLRRLVEIRGREHLEAAMSAGKGAILCCGHFGSYDSGFSVLHASGFPLTTIGRRTHMYAVGLSPAERWFREMVYARPLRRYRQQRVIEPRPGRPEVAARAAAALRANQVVTISIDAPPLDSDQGRAIEVAFLGRRTKLMPGVVALAQVTGAPLLMGFLYRAADYRHQVWEISPPVPTGGQLAAVLGRCAAEVTAAIRRSPAHWDFWDSTDDLVKLGLIRPQHEGSLAAGAVSAPAGRLLDEGVKESVPARQ